MRVTWGPADGDRASAWAAALAGAVLAAPVRLPMPPFLPIGDQPPYDASIPRVVVVIEPIVHAPWLGIWARPLAMAASAVVLVMLWRASRRVGATAAGALIAALGFAARPDVGAALAAGSWALVGAALLWSALATSRPAAVDGRRALLAGAAVACWPPWLAATPLLLTESGWRRRAAMAAGLALGALVGLAWWAQRASAVAGTSVSLADVWQAGRYAGWRGSAPFVWPPLSAPLMAVTLMGLGAAVWSQSLVARWRWIPAAVGVAVIAWRLPGWTAETVRAIYWLAWPLAGVGVSWFAARASTRGRPWALAAISVVFVGAGLAARVRDVDLVEPRAFAAALTAVVTGESVGPFTAIAEDPRVDTALLAMAGADARVRRIPGDPLLIERAREERRAVIAFPTGRALAELWGFAFRRAGLVESPLRYEVSQLVGREPCIEVTASWSRVPAGVDRLGVHLPAGSGRLEIQATGRSAVSLEATTILRRRVGIVSAVESGGVQLTVDALPGIAGGYQVRVKGEAVAARASGLSGPAWVCAAGTPTP